jgi:hypothetical protein
MKKLFIPFLTLLFFCIASQAQETDLLDQLEAEQPKEKVYTTSTFKGTRLINHHTVETFGKRTLEFRIGHRFGDVGDGEETFWGMDNAHMNITLDYGITNRFTAGIGRNSFGKLYEGVLKYKLLAQVEGGMPLTVTVLGKANVLSNTKGSQYDDPVNAWSYMSEVLIARKFSKRLSLQLIPTYIHINLVPVEFKTNDIFSLSATGRFKFTRSVAVTAEYTQTLNDYYDTKLASYIPVFSAGFDIETGGHVFQLFFSNATTLNEVQFIPSTSSDWGRGQYRFGFNVSRTFGGSFKKKN